MSPIFDFLKNKIDQKGPLKVSDYMRYRLYSPEIGYYYNQQKMPLLGQEGDFVTAPEISPLFGEMVALRLIEHWEELGKVPFALVEWGPGRGYLMADILRTFQMVPEIFEGLTVHLVETSPFLKTMQQQQLQTFHQCPLFWHDNDQSIPWENAVIGIGNEFLDAFPTDQWIKTEQGWQDRVIKVKENALYWDLGSVVNLPYALRTIATEKDDIIEFSQEAYDFVKRIGRCLKKGGFLFIDYGPFYHQAGETLQAVKNHSFCSVLDTSAIFDITAHVQFFLLNKVAQENGLTRKRAETQATFLQNQGILKRALALIQKKGCQESVEQQLYRLLHNSQMGSLFKVVEWTKENKDE